MSLEFLNNPMFLGGAGLGALGIIGMWARSFSSSVFSLIKREVITSLEVPDSDYSFRCIETWLSEHEYAKKNKYVTVKTKWDENNKPYFIISPAPGLHFIKEKGRWYWVIRERRKLESSYDSNAHEDTFYISTLFGDVELIRGFVQECYEVHEKTSEPSIEIWYCSGSHWNSCNKKEINVPNRLILTKEQESIFDDAKKFLESRESYTNDGVPWRRGYLLWGPPGGGKSSVVIELAKQLKSDVYFLNLATSDLTDSNLVRLMTDVNAGGIVVIEEIDTIFKQREKVDSGLKSNSLTFGGLLNVLDGIPAKDGRIVMITTNHPELLDSALVRPGRVDKRIEFGPATLIQIEGMVERYFGEENKEAINKIYSLNPSMAQLQEWCIGNRGNVESLMSELNAL